MALEHLLDSGRTGLLLIIGPASIIFTGWVFVVYMVYNVYFHPLSKFPGPKLWAATKIPYVNSLLAGRLPHDVFWLHRTYGPVVRTGPDEISYSSAEAWKDIYGHQSKLAKSETFYVRNYDIINANDADHARYRRLFSHSFSEKALRDQQALMKVYIDLLIQRLHEQCKHGNRTVDMVSWYNWTTFDMIGDLAYGEPFGCLEKAVHHPWVDWIVDNIKGTHWLAAAKHIPWLAWYYHWIEPKKVMQQRMVHIQLAVEKANKRLANKTQRPDFMTHVISMSGTEQGMTDDEIRTNANILISAGSETTATALCGVTYYLLRSPEALKRLTDEIRTAFPGPESEIDMNTTSGLKYLHAVLEESLRLYPPVSTGLPRVVGEGGKVIADAWVPEKTTVSVHALSSFRSEDNFLEPESFIPERWLGDARFATDKRHALQPFSIGPRSCLGRNLAYAEMRQIIARMLWNFDFQLLEGQNDWVDQDIYVVWQKKPLWVRLTPKTRDPEQPDMTA